MSEEYLEMSQREVERLKVIEQVISGHLSQIQGAKLVGITTRQFRRLSVKYKEDGAKGLISGHRGKPSNHQLPTVLKETAIATIATHYPDFGPTLAAEYLNERHKIKLSVETVRQLMLKKGLWHSKRKKKKRIHQQRLRRERFGELIQLDGSYHDWFEGRAAKCCLLVFIDDATSAIVHMYFCKAETTHNYFKACSDYFEKYGLPAAFYSDKHGVFRVNIKDAKNSTDKTQFGRAMDKHW